MQGDTDINKKVIKLGELNKLAHEDLILSIITSSTMGKVAFGLVTNEKSMDFPKGNCKIAYDKLVSKYTPHIALSLLKLKSEFYNNKLELIEKDPVKWISSLEGLRIWMNEFRLNDTIMDKDCMIHILNICSRNMM